MGKDKSEIVAETEKQQQESQNIRDFEKISELAAQQQRQGNQYMRDLKKRVVKNKDAKSAHFYAEGKFLVKETREEINTMIADFRKNIPQLLNKDIEANGADNKNLNFTQRLDLALQWLSEASSEMNIYTEESTPSREGAYNVIKQESINYNSSVKALDKAVNFLSGCFIFEESDSDDSFRKLYATTVNLHSMMTSIATGGLKVPSADTKTENGKTVHFVNNLKSPNFHEPLADYVDSNKKRKSPGNDYDVSDAHYYDFSKYPLFAHDPRPEDVCQFGLGDCYMLSMLSSIAQQDPQFIKDSMVDNGNDVTVRFFNKNREPVYVTVDKKIPGFVNDPNGDYAEVYSKGPLWVKIIEKAYATSGLKVGKLKEAENGEYFGNHKDIVRGYAIDFVAAFMGGNYVHRDVGENISIPTPNNEKELTEDESFFIDRVRKAEANGMIMYAGTRFKEDKPEIQNEKTQGKGKDDFTGLYSDHAHSLVGIVKQNGRYYVKVRNPHGHMGRVYNQNGEARVDKDVNGYNLVDIKVFGHYFDTVVVAKTKTDLLTRRDDLEVNDLRAMYGETVNIIEKTLRQTDGFFMKAFNSPEFTKMRQSSLRLKEAMDDKYSYPNIIKTEFENLFTAAKDYLKYRDSQNRDYGKELGERAANRYQMAELIVNLGELYINNPLMKKANPMELVQKCGELGNNPSQAKQASVQVFKSRMEQVKENNPDAESVKNEPEIKATQSNNITLP